MGYLYHFTKDKDSRNAREDFFSILDQCFLKAYANKGLFVNERVPTVSLSGNHLLTLDKLVQRRESQYGLCFNQKRMEERGFQPVVYLNDFEEKRFKDYLKGSSDMRDLRLVHDKDLSENDKWRVDKAYGNYVFDWEEEWRKKDNLNFDYNDLFFLIAPEEERDRIEDVCSVALISYETVEGWHHRLLEEFGTVDLQRVDPEQVEEFLSQRLRGSLRERVSLMNHAKQPQLDLENPYLTQSGELADDSQFAEEACETGMDLGKRWD